MSPIEEEKDVSQHLEIKEAFEVDTPPAFPCFGESAETKVAIVSNRHNPRVDRVELSRYHLQQLSLQHA
jgi:hypothetical protein